MTDHSRMELEQAANVAFEDYKKAHPSLSNFLEQNSEMIINHAVDSIAKSDALKEALQIAEAEARLAGLVSEVAKQLPKIIGIL